MREKYARIAETEREMRARQPASLVRECRACREAWAEPGKTRCAECLKFAKGGPQFKPREVRTRAWSRSPLEDLT